MTPVQRQDVITRDKVFMGVDAVVFYKVKPDESVKASQYSVNEIQPKSTPLPVQYSETSSAAWTWQQQTHPDL